jgi:hypothetical protein
LRTKKAADAIKLTLNNDAVPIKECGTQVYNSETIATLNELVAAEMSADEGKPYRISKKRWS